MNTRRPRAAKASAAAAALLVLGCVPDTPPFRAGGVELERATPVMGTLLRLRVDASDSALARRALAGASRAVFRVDSLMSTYKPTSELSALADSARAGAWVALSPETAEVLAASLDWAARSEGAFDPTVGPLMEAWGFHAGTPHLPAPDALARARQVVGWTRVEFDSARSRARLAVGTKLDFGAIAKGYALDLALAAMRRSGATAGMADLGGNVSVFGAAPDPAGWVLGIRDPRASEELMGTIAVDSGSVSTSGDYEQQFEVGGVRYGHIMNPPRGEPARGVVAVTVAAPTGIEADALSTLLYVLGSEEGAAFLRREHLDDVTVVWVRDPGARALTADDVVVTGGGRVRIELPAGAAVR